MTILDSAEKEQKLIIDAIHYDENSEMLEALFRHIEESSGYFFEDEFRQGLLSHNENNIMNVIRIIKENGLDKEWRNENIFTDIFAEICAIPIFLPVTFMGLLSGEFIVYLLHGDNVRMYWPDSEDVARDEGENNADYYNRVYNKKYMRLYGRKDSYVEQLQTAFSIDVSSLIEYERDISGFTQRTGTKLDKLFDMYSYLKIGKIFDKNASAVIFRSFSKAYTEIFPMRMDRELNVDQKNILLFKTFLFQEVNDEDQRNAWILSSGKISVNALDRICHEIRSALSALEVLSNHPNPEIRNTLNYALYCFANQIENTCNACKARFDTNKTEAEIISTSNLYQKILSSIIIHEKLRDLERKENAFYVKFDSEESWDTSINFLGLQMLEEEYHLAFTWKDFYSKNKCFLKHFLGEKRENDYKKIWLMAIKVLLYCQPEKLNFYLRKGIPKTPTEKWFKENKISLDKVKLSELYSMMCIIERSKNVFVCTTSVQDEEEPTKKQKKIYNLLIQKNPSENVKTRNLSLFSVLDNIRYHNSPELREQIAYLVAEQSNNLTRMSNAINCVRNIYKEITASVRSMTKIVPDCSGAVTDFSYLVERWNEVAINIHKLVHLNYQPSLSWMAAMRDTMAND